MQNTRLLRCNIINAVSFYMSMQTYNILFHEQITALICTKNLETIRIPVTIRDALAVRITKTVFLLLLHVQRDINLIDLCTVKLGLTVIVNVCTEIYKQKLFVNV